MKKLTRLSLLLLLFLPFACTEKEEAQPEFTWTRDAQVSELTGRWLLVRTIGGLPGPPVTIEVKDSRRSFEFGADSTFTLTDFDGTQAGGKFALKKDQEGKPFLLLTYQPDLSVWNRGRTLTPVNQNMLVEDLSSYDGPTFFYQQVATGATK